MQKHQEKHLKQWKLQKNKQYKKIHRTEKSVLWIFYFISFFVCVAKNEFCFLSENASANRTRKFIPAHKRKSGVEKTGLFRIDQMGIIDVVQCVFQVTFGEIVCHSEIHIQIISAVFCTCTRYFIFIIPDEFKHFGNQSDNIF